MLDDTSNPQALETPAGPLHDPALMAVAGFLAGYSGTTRAGYTIDRNRQSLDRHATYTLAAFVAGATSAR